MATTHLDSGYDVIVPQFLAREPFILELEAVARNTRACFIELALIVSREEALCGSNREVPTRRISSTETVPSCSSVPAGSMNSVRCTTDTCNSCDAVNVHRVRVIRYDVDSTLTCFIESLIEADG